VISGTSTVGATIVFVGSDPHFPDQDVDVFSFSISPGQPLDSIILTSFSYNTNEGYLGGATGNGAFMAIQQGNGITDPISAAALIGTGLVGFLPNASQGDDVLAVLGRVRLGGLGFAGPLGQGQYTIWYQDRPTNTGYTFAFNVTAVPEPGTAILFGIGLAGLATRQSSSSNPFMLHAAPRLLGRGVLREGPDRCSPLPPVREAMLLRHSIAVEFVL
jgi:hypothetical protein